MLRLGILVLLIATSLLYCEDITFEFSLNSEDVQVSQWMGKDIVSIPGGAVPFQEGYPALEGIPYTFLIPQRTSINSVTVDVHSSVTLTGRYDIAPVTCSVLSKPFSPAALSPVYFQPDAFPSSPVERTVSGNKTGFRLGSFTLVPFSYNPVTGDLSVITSATVTVECTSDSESSRISFTQEQISTAAAGIEGIVSNPEKLAEFSPSQRMENDGDPVWVAIGDSSMEAIVQPLVDHRNVYTGYSEFVSVEWIQNNCSGYDTQEKIRNYLKDQFYNHSLIYALIIGDYGETTRISSLVFSGDTLNNVTDQYYIDLDGTWDLDGDHLYGEANDGMDYYSDLYVGRFSSDNGTLVQYMVDKAISYETQASAGSWQKTAILIGAGLWPPDYWGSFVCDSIDSRIPSDWTVHKLYETAASHPNNQIELINEGSSYVTPQGHGWPGGIAWYDYAPTTIISTANYNQLTNIDKLSVFHSIACMSGELTSNGCIAERLMFSPWGGAIAVMFNSSYGWGTPPSTGPSEWLEIMFAEQLFENNVYQLGATQATAKDAFRNLSSGPLSGWIIQENNLLGDPAETFVSGQTGIESNPQNSFLQPVLYAPTPNPASAGCSISWDIPFAAPASLTLYDVTGRAVRNILAASLPAGTGSVVFDGKDNRGRPLPSGCYSVIMNSSCGTATTMMAVVR